MLLVDLDDEDLAELGRALRAHRAVLARRGRRLRPTLEALDASILANSRQGTTKLSEVRGAVHNAAMEPVALRKPEVAEMLSSSVRTVERLIEGGQLAAVRVGGGVRVLRSEVDGYLRSLAGRGEEAAG